MESDQAQPAESGIHDQISQASSVRAPDLGLLLQEEPFLLMVFDHLVGHGLQECRRVCKAWHAACKLFPVSLFDVTLQQLEKAVQFFPNTIEISPNFEESNPTDANFFYPVAALTSLQRLSFKVCTLPTADQPQPGFRPMPRLTELDITIYASEDATDMVASIKYLTALTKLRVYSIHQLFLTRKPFVELEKIQDLEVEIDLFTDEHGTCFFPSLANLTRLALTANLQDPLRRRPHSLSIEAVTLFASSLQYLSLEFSSSQDVERRVLESLSSLTAVDAVLCWEREGFWNAMLMLPSVTSLSTATWGCVTGNVERFLPMLRGLKKLDARYMQMHAEIDESIALASKLTHLTDLTISVSGLLISELSCLVQLTRLSLLVRADFESATLDDMLSCMSNLRTFEVKPTYSFPEEMYEADFGNLTLTGAALANMHQLNCLGLDGVGVDESFFHQLASTETVTELSFSSVAETTYDESFISQFNVLESLEELWLLLGEESHACKFLSPERLSRLKCLRIDGTQEEVNDLHSRFAALGRPLDQLSNSRWSKRLAA